MKTATGLIIGSVIFLAGWSASDLLKAERLAIVNSDGDVRVSIGTDQAGGGFLIIKGHDGNEVFAVRGSQVIMPGLRGASTPPLAGPAPSRPARVAQLLEVEALEPDPDIWLEIRSLRNDADTLDAKADGLDQRVASLSDSDRGRAPESRRTNKAKITALRTQAQDARSEAKRARGESRRLEREADTTRQRVRCWDGQRVIVLETRRDLSQTLTRIAHRDFVSWRGVRRTMVEGLEVYAVTSIVAAQRPAGFRDYRAP